MLSVWPCPKFCRSVELTLYHAVKMLDCSILEALADDKINMTEILKFALEMVENIKGKGENASY